MYAVRRHYVRQWDHQKPEERYSVVVTRGGKPVTCIQPERISEIKEEVMYWRKANHIHGWFVDNIQDGKDDCKSYFVTQEELRELLDVCERVIESSELVEGTVYAGTVYDQEHPEGLVMREPGKVIKDATVAKELLPTRAGFFFGTEEYDEYYLKEVVRTRDWINQMLSEPACCDGDHSGIHYSSSW